MTTFQIGQVVLAKPLGLPIGHVGHISDDRLWIAIRGESVDIPVSMGAATVDERGRVVLSIEQVSKAARLAVKRQAGSWQPAAVPSFVERVCAGTWSVEEIHESLDKQACDLGFGGLAVHEAETLVAYDHPDAPMLVFVVEDLAVCKRIRAYDGSRMRLGFVPAEWEDVARAILAKLPDGIEPDEAERLVVDGEALARNARAEREARAEEEREKARARQQEEARLQAAREMEERRARLRAELLYVCTEVWDDFITACLPGSVLPKRAILSALRAWLASQHLEKGKVESSSTHHSWNVEILSAPARPRDPDLPWRVEIRFTRDEGIWTASYSSPVHAVEGWRTPEEETRRILDVAGVVEEVYASIEPEDIGLKDDQ